MRFLLQARETRLEPLDDGLCPAVVGMWPCAARLLSLRLEGKAMTSNHGKTKVQENFKFMEKGNSMSTGCKKF